MIESFIINILASIFFVLCGYLLNIVIRFLKFRPFKKLWKPFLNDKQIIVILTTRPGPHKSSTPRVSLNELQSYSVLNTQFSKFNIKVIPQSTDLSMDELKKNNLIVLGGPSSNEIARRIWLQIQSFIPFSFDYENHIIHDINSKYEPLLDSEGKLKVDYGLLIRMKNPYNREKSILLSMGCHGYSTSGSIEALTRLQYAKQIIKQAGIKDFISLLKFDIDNNIIVNFSVERTYLLIIKPE